MMSSVFDAVPEISYVDDLTLEQAKADARSYYEAKYQELTGDKLSLEDADPLKLELDTIAYLFYSCAMYIDSAAKQNNLKYSTGAFLDNYAAGLGMTRQEPLPAKCTIRFTLSEVQAEDYTIPEGTRCSSDDDLFFASDTDAVIPAGNTYVDVPCTCTSPGVGGNGYSVGAINVLVDTLPYVSEVSNITVPEGGSDIEDDEAFAERIFYRPSIYSTAGVEDAYIYHAKSASPLVGEVQVFSPEPCEVNVVFCTKDGSVPSSALISQVQSYLNDKSRKPLCDHITVSAPDTVTYNIEVTYYVDDADRSRATDIQASVADAISSYEKWQKGAVGRDINPSRLNKFIMDAGAKRCVITQPVFTAVDVDELPVLGTVSVTYGGVE